MAQKELDFFEYSSDVLAQAAYVANVINALQAYSEATIKEQGSYALKVVALNTYGPITETFNYSSSGTWVCPLGVYSIQIECWGAGGNGRDGVSGHGGGGGGGGAYAKKNSFTVVPGQSYSYSVPMFTYASGMPGDDCWFDSAATVLAKGGSAGGSTTGGQGGQAASCVGDVKDSGTNGSNSSGTTGGNGGSAGGSGGGGGSGASAPNNGGSGTVPGGGGGGGGNGGLGGASGAGRITITYSTTALNHTLTRTVSPVIDLNGFQTIKFQIRSSRTGSNIKIGIRDSGGVYTEITPNVTSANTWQQITWDISTVKNSNKNAIDRIIITIVNVDSDFTFYLDDLYGEYTPPIYSLADLNVELRDRDGNLKEYLTPFITDISWEWQRLGGCGNCSITLGKAYRSIDFEELDDIQIRMRDGVTSKLVYRGFINDVTPTLKKNQDIVLNVKGYFEFTKRLVVHTSGSTRTYTSQEISVIVADIIDTFVAPNSFITKGTIDAGTFTCDTIEFFGSVYEALQTLAELAGNVEFGVDEDLAFFWHTEDTTVKNKFFAGIDIRNLERRVNYGKVVNRIYFTGGDVGGTKYTKIAGVLPIGAVTSGPFQAGETIVGETSGAQGTVISAVANGASKLYFIWTNAIYFQESEIIHGNTSGAHTTIGEFNLSEETANNGSITTDTVAKQYLETVLQEKADPEINIRAEILNTALRMEDIIPMGKVAFADPEAGKDDDSDQVNMISYQLSDSVGRFNIQIETGDTILDTAAKLKRLDMAIKNAQQYT